MKLEDHENSCIAKLGMPFTEVHQYLDQYFPLFRNGNHRLILHHQLGVSKCISKFAGQYGYEGMILVRQAAELHITDDLSWVPESWHEMEHLALFLNEEEREFQHCIELEFP